MSFIGCVGNLMQNSGLEAVMKSAFGGVPKMLSGKNFPNNFRALRMVVEEVLKSTIENVDSPSALLNTLDNLCSKSKTSKLLIDCLIKPVLIMMRFARAEREGEWPLHL